MIAVGCGVVIAACGPPAAEQGASQARRDLNAALDRLAHLSSFRLTTTSVGGDDTSTHIADFQPPDRRHDYSSDGGFESFVIGSHHYLSVGNGDFEEVGADREKPGALAAFDVLRTGPVVRRGPIVSSVGTRDVTYSATLDDGLLAAVTITFAGQSTTGTVSMRGTAPTIVGPGPDRIVSGRIQQTGPSTSVPEVHLPPLPTGFSPSDLQIRPVLDGRGACATSPSPAQPRVTDRVSLPAPDGDCLLLGNAELVITRAQASVRSSSADGTSTEVDLELLPADAHGLDQFAGRHVGSRGALVMFGRIVSAPFINSTEFNGRATIAGLDRPTAATVIASLAP